MLICHVDILRWAAERDRQDVIVDRASQIKLLMHFRHFQCCQRYWKEGREQSLGESFYWPRAGWCTGCKFESGQNSMVELHFLAKCGRKMNLIRSHSTAFVSEPLKKKLSSNVFLLKWKRKALLKENTTGQTESNIASATHWVLPVLLWKLIWLCLSHPGMSARGSRGWSLNRAPLSLLLAIALSTCRSTSWRIDYRLSVPSA